MANNYTQFSFTVPVTRDQARWLLNVYNRCAEGPVLDDDLNPLPLRPVWAAAKELVEQCDTNSLAASVNLAYDDGGMWFYADECGDVEFTAYLIQAFLETFNLPDLISFRWAETCSARRVNEFHGGAVVISKEDVHFQNTQEWIAETSRQILASRA